ncbi:proline-rich protein HaeIII subfamily 1-like [Phocoena phocoena]|uniref:proline-rich protein HaeIII subfamily 1-like n=1 Tax=Phocoena phocoena TaxID=9742 RepID=UPI0033069FF9
MAGILQNFEEQAPADLRQGLRAGGFIRATPLGCLSPPRSPPPAPQLSCPKWVGSEREGRGKEKHSPKTLKRKHPPGQRVRGKLSARVPGSPPAPHAGRSPGEPPAPDRPPPTGPRPSVRRSVLFPTPIPPTPDLPRAQRGVCREESGRGWSGHAQPAEPPAAPGRRRLHDQVPGGSGLRGPAPAARAPRPGPPPQTPLVEFFPPAAVTLNRPERGLFLFRNQRPENGCGER